MPFLDNLNWRYATKEFDNTRTVPTDKIDKILEAIRMAPSSFGLEPLHVYIIKDLSIRKEIKLSAFSQKQIDSCSHLLVFCYINSKEKISKRINDYANLINEAKKIDESKSEKIKSNMKNSMENKSSAEFISWSMKQSYIALGFAIAACAELKIDSCPMEGFDKKSIDKILKLPDYLSSAVLLPIGYRKENPTRPKLRFPNEDLFTNL